MPIGQPGIPYGCSDVDTQDNDTEVEAQTGADAHAHVIQEMAGEGGAYTGAVVCARPDITSIDEQGPADDGEQLGPVFEVHFQLDITGLVRQEGVLIGVPLKIGTWPQGSAAESADVVGAAGKELFYERHAEAVAIGDTDAARDPGGKHAVSAEAEVMADIAFKAGILREGGIEYLHLFFIQAGPRNEAQDIAGEIYIPVEVPIMDPPVRSRLGVIIKIIGAADDKLLFDRPCQGDVGVEHELVSRSDIGWPNIVDGRQGDGVLGLQGLFEDVAKASPDGCQGILLASVKKVVTRIDPCLWYEGAAGTPVERGYDAGKL
jgi:hypothetical protein